MCLCPHLVGWQTLKSPQASRALQSVCTKPRDIESRLLRTLLNRSRGCQTLINLHRVASSRTHLVLQAYWLIDVDENNPLGNLVLNDKTFFDTRWYRGNSVGT